MTLLAHSSAVGHAAAVTATVAVLGAYVWLWSEGRSRRVAPVWAAGGAAAVFLLATSPPLEAAAVTSFTGHMVQHLLLWLVAAPLIALARPVVVCRRARPAAMRTVDAATERILPRSARSLAAPLAGALFATVVFATHLTGFYDAALGSPILHELEHAMYLGSAAALWSAAGPTRSGAGGAARIGSLVGLAVAMIVLSISLTTGERALYATYVDSSGGTAEALDDQRRGGTLMWIGMMVGLAPVLVWTVMAKAQAEHRSQLLREAVADWTEAGFDSPSAFSHSPVPSPPTRR